MYKIKGENKEERKMTFTAYIQRQKNIIRSRHEGEMLLVEKGEIINITNSELLLNELDSLKGLNKRERCEYAKRRAYAN